MSGVSQPTRRTLVKGAAWSVPVVAVAGAAPAVAASRCTQISLSNTCDTYQGRAARVVTFTITGALPASVTFSVSNYTNVSVTPNAVAGASYNSTNGTITLVPTASSGTLAWVQTIGQGNDPQTVTITVNGTPCTTNTGTGPFCIRRANCNC